MTGKALEIENIGKIYRARKLGKVHALGDLNLSIEQGEVFGFLGPNGAGKSTTIKLLMGLIRPTSGNARIFGIPIADSAARRRVGYLPENPNFYDYLTGREYLAFVARIFAMEADRFGRESARVLDLLELRDAADRPIRTYSKGMVQRLGLAQALIHDPDLYILDEPMSGLDPLGRSLVKEIIRDLKGRGKTVFFSTHITADIEALCDRVGIISQGTLKSLGNVEDLLREGIEGYHIQVLARDLSQFSPFKIVDRRDSELYCYVADTEIHDFLQVVTQTRSTVVLIEPVRKDIEHLFVEIVKGG